MSTRPRVVVVGAGFGGLSATKALARSPVDVTVIDRHNYHLFQPLLYQVATAGLSPGDIAWPIRSVLRRQRNARVLLGEVTGIDVPGRQVLVGERSVPYDYLVLATGCRHAYFGHDEWAGFAPGLKSIGDATAIRERVLLSFERAELEDDADERRRQLTFVMVGGGPTGVEMAGAIAELANRALVSDFRNIDPRQSRIVLVEAGPRLLPTFPESLSERARRSLERLGVEVRLGEPVTRCDANGVHVGEERIGAATVVWAAGVAASPAARWLQAEHDGAGRVNVEADLSVPGHPELFVVGDAARVLRRDGRIVPGIAPAAKQQGAYVAQLIRARVEGRAPPASFRYIDLGNWATIGRKSAVIDLGRLRLHGLLAWLLWSAAHVYFLIGARHRLVVAINWVWLYLTFERGARLIIGRST